MRGTIMAITLKLTTMPPSVSHCTVVGCMPSTRSITSEVSWTRMMFDAVRSLDSLIEEIPGMASNRSMMVRSPLALKSAPIAVNTAEGTYMAYGPYMLLSLAFCIIAKVSVRICVPVAVAHAAVTE